MTESDPVRHELYYWWQTRDDVHVRVPLPAGTRARTITCTASSDGAALTVRIGSASIAGLDPLADCRALGGRCHGDELVWTVEDGELCVLLPKTERGAVWPALFGDSGQQLDDERTEAVRKRLLLERFGDEHPGFDFSQADVTGAAPADPEGFMRDVPK